jgi:SAM-dependent methyltransferase
MSTHDQEMRRVWEDSFAEQIARGAYNTAPVEALARSVSYYLRERRPEGDYGDLHFAEMGCGAGPNLVWLAEKGITVSGVDIAPTALELARENLDRHGLGDKVGALVEGSVAHVPELEDGSLDGILESCVYQHLPREDRVAAFREVDRLVKPGGVFVGHMLERGHTVFEKRGDEQLDDDPGTLILEEGGSNIYLTNIGLSHFFMKEEYAELLPGWSVVDPCLSQYELPRSEARKRGYDRYLQSMLIVYAIK